MNTNKKAPVIITLIVILLAVGIVLGQRIEKEEIEVENTPVATSPEVAKPEATSPKELTGYTLVTVALHNSISDCWTAVNDNVYDVTSWISKHPGGKQAIIGTCGKDSSAYFNGQHGGQAQPVSVLATFKIGALIK